MRYRITHQTDYAYAGPVHESFNEVRLRPTSDEHQTCLDFDLAIDPPATVIVFADYYGNAVHNFSVPYLHELLAITATSDVVTFAALDQPLAGPDAGGPDRSPAIADLAGDLRFIDEHAEFLIPSSYVAFEPASFDLARSLLARDAAVSAYGFLRTAMKHIQETLVYQVGSTTVHSKVAEILAGGSGVCQDFSHVLISLCRQVGLPARYVSGYLGDVTESAASHAWVEAYVPPYGWVGVDPTSGGACTGRHIKLATGRDYADVTVIRGAYRGGMASQLEVAVRSEIIGDGYGIAIAHERRRGELIQYQTLGAMRQLQRLGAMSQSLGGMTQTLGMGNADLDAPASMRDPQPEDGLPRQQPQQQQQQQQQVSSSRRAPAPKPFAGQPQRTTSNEVTMQLSVGCEFQYESAAPTPAVVLVRPHPDPPHRIVREDWSTQPATDGHGYLDLFSNRIDRLLLPTGPATLRYDAVVEISGDPDPVAPEATQALVQDLPDDVLVYTLASRYCQTESLSQVAWHLFGGSEPGWGRVQAVCDWIHINIRYGLLQSTPLTTAVDVYVAGGGMCRDFAHLAITFCRALNIPARYVFGYMPDIGVPGPFPPMDFHAWFEAYLSGRWWTFDARFNMPRIGRIPIGIGRDAVDVAMVTTYGAAAFQRMVVWTEEAETMAADHDLAAGPAQDRTTSEALVLDGGAPRDEGDPA